MLPIGDPAILWPHTVCLNAIVHRFRYTLTVAVCAQVPRKSANAVGIGYCYSNDQEELELDDGRDKEYDLQLLSRHVHVSSGRVATARVTFHRQSLKPYFSYFSRFLRSRCRPICHVKNKQTVYASTSGRRMDAAKGPRERPVYPAVCWAADDYAEVGL